MQIAANGFLMRNSQASIQSFARSEEEVQDAGAFLLWRPAPEELLKHWCLGGSFNRQCDRERRDGFGGTGWAFGGLSTLHLGLPPSKRELA